MTHWTNVSTTSMAPLAAWLVAVFCVSPAFSQLDQGIAPNVRDRVPRPAGPGTVLLGNPADPVKVAENAAGSSIPNVGRPGAQQLKDSIPPGFQISPELEKWLTAWEKHSQGVQRLNGKFRLYTYDEIFQMETRAVGDFWYQSPDKGRMDFQKVDLSRLPKNAANQPINPGLKGPNGAPYQVQSREWETWNCNGSEILQIFHDKKEYNRIAIPQQYQGESIKESPLPFLFGLKKDEAKERYLMQLGPMHGKVPNGYKAPCLHVIAVPLREQDSREWSKAEVLLDSQTFLPQSIQTFDPAGTSRNVYAFADVDVNGRWFLKDPFTPSVSGMRLILDSSAQRQQSGPVPTAPASSKFGQAK